MPKFTITRLKRTNFANGTLREKPDFSGPGIL